MFLYISKYFLFWYPYSGHVTLLTFTWNIRPSGRLHPIPKGCRKWLHWIHIRFPWGILRRPWNVSSPWDSSRIDVISTNHCNISFCGSIFFDNVTLVVFIPRVRLIWKCCSSQTRCFSRLPALIRPMHNLVRFKCSIFLNCDIFLRKIHGMWLKFTLYISIEFEQSQNAVSNAWGPWAGFCCSAVTVWLPVPYLIRRSVGRCHQLCDL